MAESAQSSVRQQAPKRAPGRPFPKGVSPNPGGKTKEQKAIEDEARRLALSACPKALERLMFWANSDNPKASVAACKEILDRGLGKPVQAHELGGKAEIRVRIVEDEGDDR